MVQGQPLAVMERLCREWSVTEITYQEDMEPHSRVLEQSVDKLAKFLNIEVRLSVCLSVCLSACLPAACLPACLSVSACVSA